MKETTELRLVLVIFMNRAVMLVVNMFIEIKFSHRLQGRNVRLQYCLLPRWKACESDSTHLGSKHCN